MALIQRQHVMVFEAGGSVFFLPPKHIKQIAAFGVSDPADDDRRAMQAGGPGALSVSGATADPVVDLRARHKEADEAARHFTAGDRNAQQSRPITLYDLRDFPMNRSGKPGTAPPAGTGAVVFLTCANDASSQPGILIDRARALTTNVGAPNLAASVDQRSLPAQYLFHRPSLFPEHGLVWDFSKFATCLCFFDAFLQPAYIPTQRTTLQDLRPMFAFLKAFHDGANLIRILDPDAYADICDQAEEGLSVVASSGKAPPPAAQAIHPRPRQPIMIEGKACFVKPLRFSKADSTGPDGKFLRLFMSDGSDTERATAAFRTFSNAVETSEPVDTASSEKAEDDSPLAAIINDIGEGVLVVTQDLKVTFSNDALTSLLKIGDESVKGQDLSTIVGSLNEWIVEGARQALATGTPVTEKNGIFFFNDDTSIAVDATARPVSTSRGANVVIMITSLEEARTTRNIIDRYVGSGISKSFIDNHNFTRRTVAILFSDVRGFTSMVENLGPTESLPLLNQYFTFMEDVITNNGGNIDKFIGDAVMAVFGMKTEDNAASLAIKTSLDMYRALEIFNLGQRSVGKQELGMRVGIATGDVIVGAIGSVRRSDFTVIGETVNTAARIVDLNKTYDTDIMVDGATMAQSNQDALSREICSIALRGQRQKTNIFEIYPAHKARIKTQTTEFFELYEKGRIAGDSGDTEAALLHFKKAADLRKDDPALNALIARASD